MSVVSRIPVLLSAGAAALALPALASAADLPNAPSTYPALHAAAGAPASDPWAGLYVGAGVSGWGGKGVKGGFGGEGYVGYDHAFDNGVVLGVRASSGYAPLLMTAPSGLSQFTGTAYAGGSATVGYRMGQLTPFVIAEVDIARPTRFASLSPFDTVNAAFSGPGAAQAVGAVGVGAIYRFNNNFSFGVEAIMHTNAVDAWGWPY